MNNKETRKSKSIILTLSAGAGHHILPSQFDSSTTKKHSNQTVDEYSEFVEPEIITSPPKTITTTTESINTTPFQPPSPPTTIITTKYPYSPTTLQSFNSETDLQSTDVTEQTTITTTTPKSRFISLFSGFDLNNRNKNDNRQHITFTDFSDLDQNDKEETESNVNRQKEILASFIVTDVEPQSFQKAITEEPTTRTTIPTTTKSTTQSDSVREIPRPFDIPASSIYISPEQLSSNNKTFRLSLSSGLRAAALPVQSTVENKSKLTQGTVEVYPLYFRSDESSKREISSNRRDNDLTTTTPTTTIPPTTTRENFRGNLGNIEITTYSPPNRDWTIQSPRNPKPFSSPVIESQGEDTVAEGSDNDSQLKYTTKKSNSLDTFDLIFSKIASLSKPKHYNYENIFTTKQPPVDPGISYTTRSLIFKEALNRSRETTTQKPTISPYKTLANLLNENDWKPIAGSTSQYIVPPTTTTYYTTPPPTITTTTTTTTQRPSTTFHYSSLPSFSSSSTNQYSTYSSSSSSPFKSYFIITSAPRNNQTITTLVSSPSTVPTTTNYISTTTESTFPTTTTIQSDLLSTTTPFRGRFKSYSTPNSLNVDTPTTYSPRRYKFASRLPEQKSDLPKRRKIIRGRLSTTTLPPRTQKFTDDDIFVRSTTPFVQGTTQGFSSREQQTTTVNLKHQRYETYDGEGNLNEQSIEEEEPEIKLVPYEVPAKKYSTRFQYEILDQNVKEIPPADVNNREKFRATVEMPEMNIPTEKEILLYRENNENENADAESEEGLRVFFGTTNRDEIDVETETEMMTTTNRFTRPQTTTTTEIMTDVSTTTEQIPTTSTTTTFRTTSTSSTTPRMTVNKTSTTVNPKLLLPPRATRINNAIKTTIAAQLPRRFTPPTASLKCTENSTNAKCNEIPTRY